MLLLTLLVTDSLKPVKIGKKSKKTLKIVGEAGLGVASLTAAIGILNSLENSLAPEDHEMKKLIEAERQRLLGLASNIWSTPWPYTGGFGGLATLALVLYLIRVMRRRNSRKQNVTGDQGLTTVVFGKPRRENEDDEVIQIGDIQIPVKA